MCQVNVDEKIYMHVKNPRIIPSLKLTAKAPENRLFFGPMSEMSSSNNINFEGFPLAVSFRKGIKIYMDT